MFQDCRERARVLAESVARALKFPILSIDPIEAAMWRSGLSKDSTGIAAYEVASAAADEQLKLGLSVVIDEVNPVEAARETCRKLADSRSAKLFIIETICSDESLHKQRIEKRVRNIPGMEEITWQRVLERKREYVPWTDNHLTLDSVQPATKLVKEALAYIN